MTTTQINKYVESYINGLAFDVEYDVDTISLHLQKELQSHFEGFEGRARELIFNVLHTQCSTCEEACDHLVDAHPKWAWAENRHRSVLIPLLPQEVRNFIEVFDAAAQAARSELAYFGEEPIADWERELLEA
jgi:hypothetical protein